MKDVALTYSKGDTLSKYVSRRRSYSSLSTITYLLGQGKLHFLLLLEVIVEQHENIIPFSLRVMSITILEIS